MKILIKTIDHVPHIILKYKKSEWEKLEKKYKEIGLEKLSTNNLFGEMRSGYFYKLTEDKEVYFKKTFYNNINYSFIDNINRKIYENEVINLGIFRVVPNEKNEVMAKLDKFLNILDIEKIARVFSLAFENLINLKTEASIIFKTKIVEASKNE